MLSVNMMNLEIVSGRFLRQAKLSFAQKLSNPISVIVQSTNLVREFLINTDIFRYWETLTERNSFHYLQN